MTPPYSPSPKTSLIFIENYFIVWQFTLEYILVLLLVSIALTSQILTRIRKLHGDLTVKLPSSILSFITLLMGGIGSMSMLVVLFVSIYLVVWDLVFSIVLTFYAIMIGLGPIIGAILGFTITAKFHIEKVLNSFDIKFLNIFRGSRINLIYVKLENSNLLIGS